ncbi:MAG TPA: ribonuclease PH [Verrucomicrobiales bacterium]|nr:ribonuclease PH [Verrucomicrobiales bacterium]HCN77447.1 ribonuclease PH [Verrucomicrobiales bacterium]HRJ09714.1 ribonuclease PH [Prosthecobacter sp.]HRK15357.1 ribonuclease PH [Prosthecobacter sp.]
MPRTDGRLPDQLRPVEIFLDIAPHATASVLIGFGRTRVICAATIQDEVPRWMKVQGVPGGWLTAEYSMLPYSTLDRKERDSSRGRPDGRGIEIQRLIGRSLRAVVDLKKLGQRTLCIDCDVLQADGGTRTASITGACIAAAIAFNRLLEKGKLTQQPLTKKVAAISAGILKGETLLDLCYEEDRDADVDCNLVLTEDGEFVEIQGSGEEATFTQAQMDAMLVHGRKGVMELCALQQKAIEGGMKPAAPADLQNLADFYGKKS